MWQLDVKNVIICGLIALVSYQNNKFLSAPFSSRNIYLNSHQLNLNTSELETFEGSEIGNRLKEHTKLFSKKEILKVNDQVYVGIGYGLANCIVIECDSSYIIVDTLESVDGAKEFRNDFNKLYNNTKHKGKGVSNIIFTHYHADHTQGTSAFIDDTNNPPTIIAHAFTKKGLHRVNSISSSIVYTRAMRQFGTLTKEYDNAHIHSNSSSDTHLHVNSGIGPELLVGDAWEKSILLPTKTVSDKFTSMTIDGIVLHIYYAPGETDDQIFIYLPQSRTLLPADNIYEAFPNLYAIRGSPTRDARKWVESLDKMRYLHLNNKEFNYEQALYMVPSHTRPVKGSDTIFNLLTVYRDGIQYIHDQTLRFTNKGLTPNEMIPMIKYNMPLRIKLHPWLFEFYGTFDWSIRGIFNAYLGWFTGDAADLFPLAKSNIGQNMILLLKQYSEDSSRRSSSRTSDDDDNSMDYSGLIEFLLNSGENGIKNHKNSEECQWSLDIATNIMHLKDDLIVYKTSGLLFIQLNDDLYQRSKNLRISGLKCMAGYQLSANGRNYYLTSALEDSGNFKIKPSKKTVDATISAINLDFLFDAMMVRLKIEEISESYLNFTSCFVFDISNDKLETNGNKHTNNSSSIYSWYQIEFRDGIIEIIKGSDLMTIEESTFGWLLSKEECIDSSDLAMTTTSEVYRELAAGTRRSSALLYAQGMIKVLKGSILSLKTFTDSFERD